MKLLVLQETDWIKRGPHQQHHLMDRMALKGHEIRVIDHEYIRRYDDGRKMITGRKEIKGAYKIFRDADITLIRPDVIIAFGILNAYLRMKQARNMIERERTWENPFGDGLAGEKIRRIMTMVLGE